MRIIFLGTPDFALPSLKALVESKHEIAAVVTNPDRPGNKLKPAPPPVKQLAQRLGLKVLQYGSIRKEGAEDIKRLCPDLMVTAAFGQILSREILNVPKHGVINVHGSLLPKYRGASPVQQAILNGDKITGVTIMRTVYEVDSGDILLTKSIDIGADETAGELFDRLAELGAEALVEALSLIDSGKAVFTQQNHSEATFCKTIKKDFGIIDFSKSAEQLHNFVRGLNPWPAAYTYVDGKLFKIWRIEKVDERTDYACGTIVLSDIREGIVVQVGDGTIRLSEVQLEGGRRMSGREFLIGHRLEAGRILGR